jgi:hypothetical protein
MMKLAILDFIPRESGFLELPIKVVATIFEHMQQRGVFLRVLKVVKYLPTQGHINDISEAIKIWRCADKHAPGAEKLHQPPQDKVPRYRKMFDDFRKKDEVKLGVKRRVGLAQIPEERFDAKARYVVQVRSRKVHGNPAILPKLVTHKGQLSSAHIQDVNCMRRSQRGEPLDTFFVT